MVKDKLGIGVATLTALILVVGAFIYVLAGGCAGGSSCPPALVPTDTPETIVAAVNDEGGSVSQEVITMQPAEKLVGTIKVSGLLNSPVYDTEVSINGKVTFLGPTLSPRFELSADGKALIVWYSQGSGTDRPLISVEGVEDGQWVIVQGVLNTKGEFLAREVYSRCGQGTRWATLTCETGICFT